MKSLYLTREQAKQLGEDLIEYVAMRDSSERDLFEGFQIRFGDLFGEKPQPEQALELHPLPNWCEINDDL